jgi:hypothetical protein
VPSVGSTQPMQSPSMRTGRSCPGERIARSILTGVASGEELGWESWAAGVSRAVASRSMASACGTKAVQRPWPAPDANAASEMPSMASTPTTTRRWLPIMVHCGLSAAWCGAKTGRIAG